MSYMLPLLTVLDAGAKDTDSVPMQSSERDRYKLRNYTNMNVHKL